MSRKRGRTREEALCLECKPSVALQRESFKKHFQLYHPGKPVVIGPPRGQQTLFGSLPKSKNANPLENTDQPQPTKRLKSESSNLSSETFDHQSLDDDFTTNKATPVTSQVARLEFFNELKTISGQLKTVNTALVQANSTRKQQIDDQGKLIELLRSEVSRLKQTNDENAQFQKELKAISVGCDWVVYSANGQLMFCKVCMKLETVLAQRHA